MGPKIGLIVAFFLIVAAGLAASSFGFLGLDDILYIVKLIGGWTAYTCVIALIYAGIERLIPGILCTASQDPAPPNA